MDNLGAVGVESPSRSKVKKREKRNKKQKVHIFPFWLRWFIVIVLIAISTLLGLIVGYGIIGTGEIEDAIKISTWKYLFDLINT